VRANRYRYREKRPGLDDYDKLDVEDVFLSHGATSLRLPMVYGEHDYQLREDYILRRCWGGRRQIPKRRCVPPCVGTWRIRLPSLTPTSARTTSL
jgi:hypothetical protein